MSDGQTQPDRAFVLGLDGVPWGKLNGWIDDGNLPNFERLRESGAAGKFESTTPATTPLAWPSIATGVWPDKHGIYWFQRLQEDYGHTMNTSRNVEQPALWNMLSPAIVANVPMTYPAESIDGEVVAGMMTPEENERFTHPPELGEEIRERIPDYEVGLSWSEYEDRPDAFAEDIAGMVAARRELMRLLMDREEWRLFFFVYTAPDRLQHLLWEESVLIDHYQLLDDILGEVMEYVADREALLFVVSDHGFGPIEKYASINTALEEHGYLVRSGSGGTRGILSNLGVTKENVLSMLDRVGVDERTLVEAVPTRVVDTIARQVPGSHALYDVDFEQTQAFVHGTGCLYVNDADRFKHGPVDPSERAAVKDAVAEALEGVTDPETGDHVFEVHDGEEIFETDSESPDLVVGGAGPYRKVTELRDQIVGPRESESASHHSEGVFFAWGPSVDVGATPESASVVDLAPTLLHGLGEPVPDSMDGSVLSDIFTTDAAVDRRRIGGTGGAVEASAEEDFDDVEERLSGLGYLS
ncbi:MAG: alkaline phosphatase family protein [Halosimplex sp.]